MKHALLKPKPLQLADFHRLLVDVPYEQRWELIGGQILKSMVGARWEHARIVSNLHIGLGQRLRAAGSPCRLYAESFRLEIGEDTSLFPDIMIACTPVAPRATSLRTPTVLMEILSDDPKRDLGVKWDAYRTIDTLRHYVIVERDTPTLRVLDRVGEGSAIDAWSERPVAGIGATLDLPAVDVSIPLAEIYADLFA